MSGTELRNEAMKRRPFESHLLKNLARADQRGTDHPEARRVGLPPHAHDIKVLDIRVLQRLVIKISNRLRRRAEAAHTSGRFLKQRNAQEESGRRGFWIKDRDHYAFAQVGGLPRRTKYEGAIDDKIVSPSVTRQLGFRVPVLTNARMTW